MRSLNTCAILFLFLICLAGCSQKAYKNDIFAMDTYMSLTVYANSQSEASTALDEAADEINEIEREVSLTIPGSDVAEFNSRKKSETSIRPHTQKLLAYSNEYYNLSDGLFDPSTAALKIMWQNANTLPCAEVIAKHMSTLDFNSLSVNDNILTCTNDEVKLDFGAIAKGYAASVCADKVRSCGITSAMLSLGGNIAAIGTKPDGSPWRVGIRDPLKSAEDYLGIIDIADNFVATSGDYERYFEVDGTKYTHIIDPRTGCPANTDLHSVTIVSPTEPTCDALSTALYIMGRDAAIQFWKDCNYDFNIILIDKNGVATVSDSLVFTEKSDDWKYLYVSKK